MFKKKSEFQQFKIVQDISQLPLKVEKQQERRENNIRARRSPLFATISNVLSSAYQILKKTKKKVYREKGAKVCNNLKRLSMEKIH